MAETDLTELRDGEIGGPIHDEVTESASITESVDFDMSELPSLEHIRPGLDCPFYWESNLHPLSYGDHEIDPLSEFEELSEEPSFCLRKFKTQLILCYHNFYKRLVEDSMKNIGEMESIIHLSTVEECDSLFLQRKDAMLRVVYSCRYFILHSTNQTEEAEKIFEKVEQYMAMSEANQAMSWAIRAAVLVEYGYEPLRTAIECMGSAIALDSGNAFWPFLKGLYLGRLRRMENISKGLPENEIENLKMALKKRRNPVFYSFIAETYLEIVEIIEKQVEITESCGPSMRELSSWSDKYIQLATHSFTKSIEGEDDSAHLLFRYGRGLMRLRHPHQDLVKAEESLRRGLKLSPKSSYGNYAMAVFIMNHKEDWEAAKLCLEKSAACRNFHAHLDLCREGFLKDEISVSVELKKLLDVYKETPKICKIYGELILYRLLVRYNLVEACSYAKSLISFQTTWIDYIYYFKSSIFPLSERVPLLKLLISEINNVLFRESCEMKKNAYKTFLHYILEEGIQTPKNIPVILSRYSEDMKAGILQHRQFPPVKSEAKKKHNGTKDELRNRRSGNSSSKEYHKYYTATKNRTVCDILPPQSGGRMTKVRRKYGHHFQRRYSGSSSERSASDREIPKHLVKGLESLAISETGISGVKEHTSSEIFSSRDKRQYSPKVENHSSRSGRKALRDSGDNRSPNSSLDRKSVNSFQDGRVNSPCARSSPESKSSGSHRERRYPHSGNREDSGSDSCNTRSGQSHRNEESKHRHKRREDSEEKSLRSDREYRQRQYKSREDGHYNSSRSRKDRSSSESTHGSERRKDSEKSSGSERENRRPQRKSRDDKSCSSSRSRKSRSGSESTNQSEHRKDFGKFSGSEREHFRHQRRDSDDGNRNSSRSREKRSSSESTRRSKRHKYFDKKSSRSDREYLHRQRRSRGDGSCRSSRFREERSSSESMSRSRHYKNPDKNYSSSDREHQHRLRRRRDDNYNLRHGRRYSDKSTRKSEPWKNRNKELSRSDHYRQRRSRDDSCSSSSSNSSSSRSCQRHGSGESTHRRDYREGHRRERSRRERSYSFDRSRRHLRDKNYPKRNKSKRSYTHDDSND